MSSSQPIPIDVLERIHNFVVASESDELTEDHWAGFEQLLRKDDDACQLYVEYMNVSMLASYILDTMPDKEPSSGDVVSAAQHGIVSASTPGFLTTTLPGTVGYFSSGWPVSYLVATLIFGLGLLVGSHTYVSKPAQVARQSAVPRRVDAGPKMEIVGRITGMVDCKWADSHAVLDAAVVPLGRKYELASGLMEITYETGAKVILQGPVTYEVESRGGGFLSVGKATAKVTTAAARGLTIRTPSATVTDLGTEFGIEVGKDGTCEVHVLKGLVQTKFFALGGQASQIVQLKEGEGRRYQRTPGQVTVIAFDRAKFDQMRIVKPDERRDRWLAYSRQLRQDPALVAYYTFQPVGGNTRVLPNLSPAGSTLDGQVEGAEWVHGRLPGKYALYFHGVGSGDTVVLPEPNRFNFGGPFSVAVWFKVERFTAEWQTLVGKGGGSWRLHRHENIDMLGFDTDHRPNGQQLQFHRTVGRTNVADGRWHLAVAVYQPAGAAARKRLYVDTRLEDEKESPASLGQNKAPVTLGCNNPTQREFYGWIDEVAILARALSAEEIATMFEAGDPAGALLKRTKATK